MENEKRYKYVNFTKYAGKEVWSCRNNNSGEELGQVKWYALWRQYYYFPTVYAVYSGDCLADIDDFMQQLAERNR